MPSRMSPPRLRTSPWPSPTTRPLTAPSWANHPRSGLSSATTCWARRSTRATLIWRCTATRMPAPNAATPRQGCGSATWRSRSSGRPTPCMTCRPRLSPVASTPQSSARRANPGEHAGHAVPRPSLRPGPHRTGWGQKTISATAMSTAAISAKRSGPSSAPERAVGCGPVPSGDPRSADSEDLGCSVMAVPSFSSRVCRTTPLAGGSRRRPVRRCGAEVCDQFCERLVIAAARAKSEHCGRVGGDEGVPPVPAGDHRAALSTDAHPPSQDRATSAGAQTDDHVRVDDGELGLQPRMTRHQMAQLGRLMDTALTTLLKPEVLDGVGEVHLVAPDPGGLQCAREDVSGWADKRLPLLVRLVARLLPDEHQPRVGAAAGEHGLGRVLPQLTAAALVDGTFQAPQSGSFRHPRARVLLVGDHRTSP